MNENYGYYPSDQFDDIESDVAGIMFEVLKKGNRRYQELMSLVAVGLDNKGYNVQSLTAQDPCLANRVLGNLILERRLEFSNNCKERLVDTVIALVNK